MGNHRFRLSDMIPNAWFYKLTDMSKTTANHHNKPPSGSYHSSSTTALPPSENTHFHNSLKFLDFHDPRRKSSKKPTPNRKTIYQRSPKHTESTHILQDFLPSPVTTQSGLTSCTRRLTSSNSDFIIDVNKAKKIDFSQEIELQLPPIITKPAKRTSRIPQTSFRQESQRKQPNSGCSRSETTATGNGFATVIGNPSVKSSNTSQMGLPIKKDPRVFSVTNPSVTTTTERLVTDMTLGDTDTPLFCSASLPSDKQTPARKSVAGVKLRSNSRKLSVSKKIVQKSDQRKHLSESFAVVKSSFDPAKDFKHSMMEMITENNIRSSKDLEELLACYLALNTDEYHGVIVKAFEEIWFSLLPDV